MTLLCRVDPLASMGRSAWRGKPVGEQPGLRISYHTGFRVVAVTKGAETGTAGRRRSTPGGLSGSQGRRVDSQQAQQQHRKPLKEMMQGMQEVQLPVSVDDVMEQSQKVLGQAQVVAGCPVLRVFFSQSKWERVEDKPSTLLLAGVSAMALYLAAVLLEGLDRVPVLGALMEGVGLGVVAMYAYRWYASPKERSRMREGIRGLLERLGVGARG